MFKYDAKVKVSDAQRTTTNKYELKSESAQLLETLLALSSSGNAMSKKEMVTTHKAQSPDMQRNEEIACISGVLNASIFVDHANASKKADASIHDQQQQNGVEYFSLSRKLERNTLPYNLEHQSIESKPFSRKRRWTDIVLKGDIEAAKDMAAIPTPTLNIKSSASATALYTDAQTKVCERQLLETKCTVSCKTTLQQDPIVGKSKGLGASESMLSEKPPHINPKYGDPALLRDRHNDNISNAAFVASVKCGMQSLS